MASRASARLTSDGSKGFDFASDDILCSYDDQFGQHNQQGSVLPNSKEFQKIHMSKSSMFPSASYSPPEESSMNQDMISAVERSMKKHSDHTMRFLEGLSSRLSQLELYCYNLDKSIGEMRSDLDRDQGEADLKLKSIEKHLQEVHRSVQILRDKQELAETQTELAKLQLSQSSAKGSVQQNEESTAPQDAEKSDNSTDMHGQQLALALPHQLAPQPSLPSPPEQPQQPPQGAAQPMSSQSMNQTQAYYLPQSQMTTLKGPNQTLQGQYMPSSSHYQGSQLQDMSRIAPHPTQSQLNQPSQTPPVANYQQQWSQSVQQMPQSSMQPQIRGLSTAAYPSYQQGRPNPPSADMVSHSGTMQVPLSGVPQPGANHQETMCYSYGGSGGPGQHQTLPPQHHLKSNFGTQPNDGYSASGPHSTLAPRNTYISYDGDGGRMHRPQPPPHYSQGVYPPASMQVQNLQQSTGSNPMVRPPQYTRSHPYNELVEKLASMGYRGEHVVSIIQLLEESGQPVDFNAVLDRLNGQPSGGSQRSWSG